MQKVKVNQTHKFEFALDMSESVVNYYIVWLVITVTTESTCNSVTDINPNCDTTHKTPFAYG